MKWMKKLDKQVVYAMVLYLLGIVVIQDIVLGEFVWKMKLQDFIYAFVVSLVLYVWNFHRSIILAYLGLTFFMSSILLIQAFHHIAIAFTALHVMINSSSLLACVLISIYHFSDFNWIGKNKGNRVVLGFLFFIFYLIPLTYWAYWAMSGQVLQADIVLAICQTNVSETVAYLRSQGILSIVILFVCTIIYIMGTVALTRFMPNTAVAKQVSKKKVTLGLCAVFYLLSIASFAHISRASEPIVMFKSIKKSLDSYKQYGLNKALREKRLQAMTGLSVNPKNKGVYVLVIGESETREHMGVYGYKRNTTPWLNELSKEKNTLVFSKAFSNHTHTVPALTYALSEKNQYNHLNLDDANSIIEIAKAAGMKTYWISNQQKYGAWDTPIAEIASTADYQVWVNGSVGESTNTLYFDERLAGQIPDIKNLDNALIVFHVMGCHGFYGDRYPDAYDVFSGDDSVVDMYDNAVLYDDFVLSKLFNDVKQSPNLKAFIMFSDHGEDADSHKSHESSKFIPVMSKIPLIINFSDSYVADHQSLVDTLHMHKDSPWTNDLMYNLLISIMGIEGAPVQESQFDLGSPSYNRNLDNLRTLHGKKKLSL